MLHCWQVLSPAETSVFLNGVKIEWPKAIIFDSRFVLRYQIDYNFIWQCVL